MLLYYPQYITLVTLEVVIFASIQADESYRSPVKTLVVLVQSSQGQ